jgi:acetylornithine deacetylase/succinyl-diaminopimelate desuccinylase-like protein
MLRAWIPVASIVTILISGCGPRYRPPGTLPPEPLGPYHTAVDWDSAGDEAAAILAAYLRVDTINPPGNESRGAEFLAEVLRREGIESTIHEHAPGRGTLVARLQGSGEEPPFCMMSHIDVVTAEDEHWPEGKGPLSGTIDDDGMIWGRGALDMKGMGVLELMTMVWAHRLGLPLKRDLILLAVADEEIDNGGARYLVDELWDELQCGHMVNEGGFGVRDAFFDGQSVYAVSVAEKGVLWVKVIAHGEPGHGSTPRPGEAPTRLVRAIEQIEQRKVQPQYDTSMYDLMYHIGLTRSGLEKAVMTHPGAVRALLEGKLMANPATAAMLTDTVHLTGMEGANEPNVIPSAVAAIFDCRVLPDTDPLVVLAELEELVDHDPNITFEVLAARPGNASPWDDPFYAALTSHTVAGRDDAVAGPIVSVGFTDSIFFRARGTRAYGLIPFDITAEELTTMHGHRERVSVANVRDGLRILYSSIVDVSAIPGHDVPTAPLTADDPSAWLAPLVLEMNGWNPMDPPPPPPEPCEEPAPAEGTDDDAEPSE